MLAFLMLYTSLILLHFDVVYACKHHSEYEGIAAAKVCAIWYFRCNMNTWDSYVFWTVHS